jgi:CRISPR-associated endonuclease/helicase Cas3
VRRVHARDSGGEVFGDPTTESDDSSLSLRAVPLTEHSAGVRDFALEFAQQAGLQQELADDIALAAYLHDAGKGHPQFQRWLYGGDELGACGPALAKSGRNLLPPKAAAKGGLPRGARHEIASVALAMAHPRYADAHDPDLVLWLVGTHHGYGRPFFPPVPWPAAGTNFIVDLGEGPVSSRPAVPFGELTAYWADLHARLHRRYGPWGLARLEAIIRLADHRRSEAEQREDA